MLVPVTSCPLGLIAAGLSLSFIPSLRSLRPLVVLDFISYFHNNRIMEIKEATIALAALAQETRLSIFRLLVQVGPEGIPVGRIGEELEVAPATLSFHLKELYHAGLITPRQESRFIYYTANFERMAAIMTFLTQNCCQGMPQECVTVVETALGDCCPPKPKPKSTRRQS
jgi:ArsR family transcriptional regulator, arsenate/arsenite/antimonite-responsive transcriptional repressor